MAASQQNLFKLPFKIVHFSSQDDEYPATELQSHNAKTKGWQTQRLCTYPQTLVIDLGADVSVHKFQFLSHQSKIASIIEIFVAQSNDIATNDFKNQQMSRLGYLSLDPNVKTNFKARELKTVFINSACRYIKLVVQDFHQNSLNIFNQVGFVALNIVGNINSSNGSVPPMLQSSASTNQLNTSQYNPSGNAGLNTSGLNNSIYTNPSNGVFMGGNCVLCYNENGQVWLSADPPSANNNYYVGIPQLPHLGGLDTESSQKVASLLQAKLAAVMKEDYNEAQRIHFQCKNILERSDRIRALIEAKNVCVMNEDYDGAKKYKVEIDVLRNGGNLVGNSNMHMNQSMGNNDYRGKQLASQPPSNAMNNHLENDNNYGIGNYGGSYDDAPPQKNVYNTSNNNMQGYNEDRPLKGRANNNNNNANSSMSEYNPEDRPIKSKAGSHANNMNEYPEDRPIKSKAGNHANNMNEYPEDRPIKSKAAPVEDYNDEEANSYVGTSVDNMHMSMVDDRPLNGGKYSMDHKEEELNIGSSEPLGDGPEALGLAASKDAEALLPILGEHIVRCLYSKQWMYRQEGCKLLLQAISGSSVDGIDTQYTGALLAATVKICKRGLDDTAVVAIAIIDILVAAYATLSQGIETSFYTNAKTWEPLEPRSDALSQTEATALIEPLLPLLLSILANTNVRLRTCVMEAYACFFHGAGIHQSALCTALARNLPVKDQKKPLVIRSRCLMINQALEDGIGYDYFNMNALSHLLTLAVNHKDNLVRETGVATVVLLVSKHGGANNLKNHLKGIPQGTLDVITKEMDKLKLNGKMPSPVTPQKVVPPVKSPAKKQDKPVTKTKVTEEPKKEPKKEAVKPEASKVEPKKSSKPAAAKPEAKAQAPVSLVGTKAVYGALDIDPSDPTCCQFCGLVEPSMGTEAGQDMHFWQNCPMLCQCPVCEQVIEVATLLGHLQTECESDFTKPAAKAFKENIEVGVQHTLEVVQQARDAGVDSTQAKTLKSQGYTLNEQATSESVCPLCFVNVGSSDRAWRVHLLAHPCENNQRIQSYRSK